MFLAGESGQAVDKKRLLIKGSVPSKNADVSNTSPVTKQKQERVSEVPINHCMLCEARSRGFVIHL